MVLVVKCLICQKELTYKQSDPSELIRHMKLDHQLEATAKDYLKQKVGRDIETSFIENSKILKNLIDKSAQTEIDFYKFKAMTSDNPLPETSNNHRYSSPRHSNGSGSYESFRNETQYESKRSSFDRTDHTKSPQKEIKEQATRKNVKNHKDEMSHPRRNPNEDENDERQKLLKDKRRSKKFYKTSIERWRPVGDDKINCPRCQSYKRPTVRTQRQHITNSSIVSSFIMTCWPLCFSPCYLPEPKYENLYCPVCNYHLGVFDHQKKIVISNPNLMHE